MHRPMTSDEKHRRVAELTLRAGQLQAVPAVVTRALRYIDDPGSSIAPLAAILNTDHTIAGRLIGLANSAFYSARYRRFVTVREAVIRLGYSAVRDLLLAVVLSGLARAPSKLYGLSPGDLWQHSLATALIARLIAEETGAANPEQSYMAGLLHDIGRAVLDRALTPGETASVLALVQERRVSYQVAEEEVLGVTHSDVGAYRLETWGVGPELVQAVAAHHRAAPASLGGIVHTADVLAIKVLRLADGNPGWDYRIDPTVRASFGPAPAFVAREAAWLDNVANTIKLHISEVVGSE